MDDWKAEVSAMPNFNRTQKAKMMLSRETDEGLHISGIYYAHVYPQLYIIVYLHVHVPWAVNSFCELAPKLLQANDVHYLLSETFSQDPLEAYFSRQRHKGGGCDNPGVQQFYYNTASLIQQREVYRDLKTMNVQKTSNIISACDVPLPKRRK